MSEELTTKERREQKRTKEILDAAQEIFTEKGYHNATVDEIADRALASKSTMYEYFDSKAKMLTAVVARGFSLLSEYVEKRISATEDPRGRLVELIRGELKFFEKRIAFFEMLLLELPGFDVRSQSEVVPAYFEHIGMIEREVRRGVEAGVLRPEADGDAAVLIFAAIHTFTFRWMIQGKKGSLSAQADNIAALIIDGISVTRL